MGVVGREKRMREGERVGEKVMEKRESERGKEYEEVYIKE